MGDKFAESVKLLVQRGLDAVVNLCRFKHLAIFGMVSYGKDAHYAVSLHYFGAAHRVVARKCSIVVKLRRVSCFVAYRLSGECGLVDTQHHRLKQFAVCRHLLAGVEYNNVANNNIFFCDLLRVAVAYNLHRFIIIHLVEQCKFLVGFELEDKCKTCGKKYGNENTYRLKEHPCALTKPPELIAGDAD